MNTEHVTFEWPSYDEIERVRREAQLYQAHFIRDALRSLFLRKERGVAGTATA